jgi:hypothetical protein
VKSGVLPENTPGTLAFFALFAKQLGWSQRLTAFFFGLPPSLLFGFGNGSLGRASYRPNPSQEGGGGISRTRDNKDRVLRRRLGAAGWRLTGAYRSWQTQNWRIVQSADNGYISRITISHIDTRTISRRSSRNPKSRTRYCRRCCGGAASDHRNCGERDRLCDGVAARVDNRHVRNETRRTHSRWAGGTLLGAGNVGTAAIRQCRDRQATNRAQRI